MRHLITLHPDPEREAPVGRTDSCIGWSGAPRTFGVLALDQTAVGTYLVTLHVGAEDVAYLDALAEAAANLAADLRAAAALTAAEGVAS